MSEYELEMHLDEDEESGDMLAEEDDDGDEVGMDDEDLGEEEE